MTFASPWVLLALVALPLLVAAYVARVRGAGAAGEAFAMPHMRASVLPKPPRWRRHLPVLAMLVAAAVLILAAARPQRSVAVEVEQASIMLATDVSGSMATDVAPNRLAAAQKAAKSFLDSVPAKVNVGVMAFNQIPTILQSPTKDRRSAAAAIDQEKISGTTATGDAVLAMLKALEHAPGTDTGTPPAAIVLLSDGKSTRGSDPVEAAKKARAAKVPIYTVALGTANGTITSKGHTEHVPPDPATLAAMAQASGGKSFSVADASKLEEVYQHLGSQLGHVTEQQQMTNWFAGAGLLMLLAAGAMSLRWFGRLA